MKPRILEVTCRKNEGLLGSFRLGELRFFDGPKGNAIKYREFADLIDGKNVLHVVHGYHNRENDADNLVERVAGGVTAHGLGYDVIVEFSWPGGLTYASFGLVEGRVSAVGAAFATLLQVERTAKSVSIFSHSLGAGVAAEALQALRLHYGNKRFKPVSRWVAVAAAIPNDSLSWGGQYGGYSPASGAVDRIFAPSSKNDGVLQWAYPIGSGGKTALGRTGPVPVKAAASGLTAADTLDIPAWPSNIFAPALDVIADHGDAYKNDAVYALWGAWLRGLSG